MLMISRMSQFRAFPAVLTGVALLSLACSGSVGGDGENGGAAAGSGVGGTSGSGGKGTGGTGNTSGSGGGPTSGVAPLTRVARLTHNQYQNTVAELFGITDRPTDAFAPDAANGFAFDTSVDYRVDGRLGGQYRTAAEDARGPRRRRGEHLFARRSLHDDRRGVPGHSSSRASASARSEGRSSPPRRRASRLSSRRVPRSSRAATRSATASGSSSKRCLQSPQFLYRAELSSTVGADGFVALDDWEIASRLSYLAWDSMPDTALFTAARQGMLHTPDQVSAAAARILAEPRALAKMVSFHEQAWRFSEYSRISPDRMAYPNAPAEPRRAASIRPRHASWKTSCRAAAGSPSSSPLRTRTPIPALAPLYGTSVSGGLARIELDPNVRKGILMQVGHLASHAYAVKTDPIHRGLFVLRDVLCRIIPDPPAGASMTPLPPTTEPIETTREEISLLTGQDGCIGCHVANQRARLRVRELRRRRPDPHDGGRRRRRHDGRARARHGRSSPSAMPSSSSTASQRAAKRRAATSRSGSSFRTAGSLRRATKPCARSFPPSRSERGRSRRASRRRPAFLTRAPNEVGP